MDFNLTKPLPQSTKTIASPSRQGTFEIVLLILVIVLGYWFLIAPKKTALSADQDTYASLQDKLKVLQNNKKTVETLIATLKTKAPQIEEMDQALPLDNRVTKLYIALQQLTGSSGMTVGDITVNYKNDVPVAGNATVLASPFKVKRSVQKFTTALNVIGTYQQFQSLLQKLETSGRLINITSIAISNSKDTQIQFTLNLESYYYGQAE